MMYMEVFKHFHSKHGKTSGAIVVGLFGLKFIISMVKRYQRHRKIQRKQNEVKEAIVRLKQQLINDGMTDEKSAAITSLSITELQQKLQKRELTALEVLKAYQWKALEVHDATNCVTEPIKEAEAIARNLDKSSSIKGPLHGIPVSFKECFELKGYDATGGLSYFIDKPSPDDAILVKAIKEAGGIPFMRTNIPQAMRTFECSNPIFGITSNPYDKRRGPGGSSGGEGAIISGGGSLLGLGTDIGGSVRIPANMCGICALKPTVQRISRNGSTGIGSGQKNVEVASGPMAQSVDGLVIAMKSLLKETMFTLDPYTPPVPFNEQIYMSKKALRIGFFTYDGVTRAVPAYNRAIEEVKTVLESLGHTLIPFNTRHIEHGLSKLFARSFIGDLNETVAQYLKNDELDPSYRISYHLYRTIPTPLRKLLGFVVKYFLRDKHAADFILCDGAVKTVDWWQLSTDIDNYKKMFINEWNQQEIDVVICPSFSCPALPTGSCGPVISAASYTYIWNVLNFPAGCIPVTKVSERDQIDLNNPEKYPTDVFIHRALKKLCQDSVGLPINIQCVALPFQEELVLRLMKEIEDRVDFRRN